VTGGRSDGRGEERDEENGVDTTRPQDTWHDTPVAETKQRSIVERLADIGEEAIQRIGNAPGGDKLLAAMANMRDRVDDLQKRVRGLEDLDKRVVALERRVDKLEGKSSTSSARKSSSSTTRKTPS
jgi:polyhydroxyalkanoate synthesis regulator phasin